MQFSKLAEEYLRHLAAYKGYSPHTVTSYETAYAQFGAYLVNAGMTDDLRHFTDAHVRAFAEGLVAFGKGTNTVRHRLGALSSLARYGMKARDGRDKPRLARDPTRSFDWPQHQRPATRFLYREELRAFLALEIPLHQDVARHLFVETGLRLAELIRADIEDVVPEPEGRAALSVTVKGRGRRAERVHTPLSPVLVGLIDRWRAYRGMPGGTEPLLIGPTGQRWTRSGLGSMIYRLALQAGITRIPVRPHVLRHTANVIARASGLDPYVRSRLLHHESPRSLERYEHLLPGELHAARDQASAGLARYLGGGIISRDYAAGPPEEEAK